MTIDIEQERKAFEDWYSDGGESMRAVERGAGGMYRLAQAQEAWRVWQARAEKDARCLRLLPDKPAEQEAYIVVETASDVTVMLGTKRIYHRVFVPEGWQLVLKEPTEEEIDAARPLFLALELGCKTVGHVRRQMQSTHSLPPMPEWFMTQDREHLTKAGKASIARHLMLAAAQEAKLVSESEADTAHELGAGVLGLPG